MIDLVGLKAVPEPKNKGKIEDSTKEIFFGERPKPHTFHNPRVESSIVRSCALRIKYTSTAYDQFFYAVAPHGHIC